MSGQADVRELREVLASDTGMDLDHMLLTEIDDQGFLRTHSGNLETNFSSPYSFLVYSLFFYCRQSANFGIA